MSIMGIDMGTTGCKAGVFSAGGDCIAHAYREYHILHKQAGWSELDSKEVMARAKDVIRETALASRKKDPVKALSISSMGEAMTPVSRDGKILGNSILSSDVRGEDLLTKTLKGIDQSSFYQINPNILGANYSLPKLLWIKKHEPDLYRRADYFLLWADMIAFMLGCEPVTSYSLANRTLLFDINREDWSDKLLSLSGIDRAMLPRPRPSGTVIGTISSKAAKDFGLNKGTAVVLGGHDQCCNAIGAGAIEAGTAVCGIGSYECITPVYDHIPDQDYMLKCGLNVEHHLVAGRYVSFLYNQAGLLVKWFRDTFAAADRRLCKKNENIYRKLTSEMPEGPSRLLVLPCFDITGPPEYIANASGVIAGLKTNTQRGEILKAIMECETFYFCDSLKALEKIGVKVHKLMATGGGAQSDQWLQIKADILGIPIIRPVTTEASLLGAAILAGVATKIINGFSEGIRLFVRGDRDFEPNRKHGVIYQERLEMYRKLFPTMRSFLADWSRITGE